MEYLRDIVAGAVLIVGAVLVIISRIPKQTIEEQKALIETLTGRIAALEYSREEDKATNLTNIKAIADLQGQVKVYREIPLGEIAAAMKEMNIANQDIASTNALILTTLQKSALIAADDRDFLTTPISQTVREQHVEHQTVEEKG